MNRVKSIGGGNANMKLIDLNIDCLLRIFEYCCDDDLENLCRANAVLCTVIEENIYLPRTRDLLMCGHRNGPSIESRNQTPLTYLQRWKISQNWKYGRYHESEYFSHSQMFASRICLEPDWFYITYKGYLRQYRRSQPDALVRRYHKEITTKHSSKTDIANFVKKGDTIFATRVNGQSFIYEDGCCHEQRLHPAQEYMYCVDFSNDVYASSSEYTSKIWRRAEEFDMVHLDLAHELDQQAFKTLRFNDGGDKLFGGLYTDVTGQALREIDVETGKQSILNSETLSIYDLKLQNENVLFLANFDTSFRMFDRRLNADVSRWMDPFDSSYYCLEYDGLYAVLCGAKYHSRVSLYDIRMPRHYIQLYFPRQHKPHKAYHRPGSSPVYSLACDSRYLFIATDRSLRVLDFKVDKYVSSHDYRTICNNVWRSDEWY